MRSLSSSELLEIWEHGLDQPPVQRGLALLVAACPDTSPNDLAELAIGERDGMLLTLREQTFGSKMVCLATCPSCSERLELALNVEEIRASPPEQDVALEVFADGLGVKFRLPNSLDIITIADNRDITMAKEILIERCLVDVSQRGEDKYTGQLPAAVIEAIAEKMAGADPQANVQLALSCPACSNEWLATFDIISFFWNEIDAWARHILQEIHALALAYGWSEAEILALSPWRRRAYLELVSQ
jgi:hypothetical protein